MYRAGCRPHHAQRASKSFNPGAACCFGNLGHVELRALLCIAARAINCSILFYSCKFSSSNRSPTSQTTRRGAFRFGVLRRASPPVALGHWDAGAGDVEAASTSSRLGGCRAHPFLDGDGRSCMLRWTALAGTRRGCQNWVGSNTSTVGRHLRFAINI